MIPRVPYDAEIEYLEGTGTQWIDTGVHGTETTKIEAGINPSQDSGISAKIFGDYSGATASRRLYGGILIGENKRTIVCKYGAITKPVFGTDGNYVPKDVISLFRMGPTGVSCGETFSASWTASNVFSTAATLYLFKYNGQADASAFIGKMYFCQIYINSSLILDLIPVRIGQTGYMYDRVTKRLFGNKGTGSFVLGPDVAKPVIGLYGMRKFYSTTDYIQDGLVAMWDGINNTGHGHDPEATVWKDLVGDRDFTLNGAVVGQDSISWNGNYRSSSSHQPPNFVQMEILFRTISGYSWKVWFGDYGHSVSSYFGAVLESKTARQDNSSYKFGALAVSIPLVAPSESGKRWANKIYEKSVLKNISGNFNYVGTDWAANTMQLGGASGLSLRCIRLYSRYLSNAEIAHNYAIDKARFNLP